jgi:hypothetical protein
MPSIAPKRLRRSTIGWIFDAYAVLEVPDGEETESRMWSMNRSAPGVLGVGLLGLVLLARGASAQSFSGPGGTIPASGTGGGNYPSQPDPNAWFSSTVNVNVSVTRVSKITINGWTHTWVGDLQVVLVSPSGAGHNVMVRPGYDSVGFYGNSGDVILGSYSFVKPGTGNQVPHSPAADMTPADYSQDFGDPNGSAPGGIWIPGTMINTTPVDNQTMDTITGTGGVWELRVYDWAAGDSGSISDWTLEVNGIGGTPPTTYCTAKMNALGCVPAMGWSGGPSATLNTGFVVSGSNVRNNKNGLLFYGTTGASAIPFQGGTLCVKSPLRRTGVVHSGGNPGPANDCSGVYMLDMNAFAHSAGPPVPLAALTVPGTKVNCQWWGRDPGFTAPNNTTLTDALEYFVGP